MTAIGHAALPMIPTPHYGTSLIGLPAAVLLAGLVMLGVRGCRLGIEPEPVPAFGAVDSAALTPGGDGREHARSDVARAALVVGLGVAP